MKLHRILVLLFPCVFSFGDELKKGFLEMEMGPVWQSSNQVAIPGKTGTRFSLKDFGGGPFLSGRIYAGYRWTERSEFRALFAPLSLKGSRTLDSNLNFQDKTFTAGALTESLYRFNSYRLTYRYKLTDHEVWKFWLGFTAKIRDAEIRLTQGATSSAKTDLGFVPLLHFRLQYLVNEYWRVDLDADALAAPQGRAEDVVVRVQYQIKPGWIANAGYRLLEGGADNDTVYTFAFLHYLVLGLQVDF